MVAIKTSFRKSVWKRHQRVHKLKRATDFLVDGDPSVEFGAEWIKAWMKTENFRIFSKFTGELLLFPPKAPLQC